MSKLQIGTTHELASVVSLPLLSNIFKKASFQRRCDSAGFMGCWNFGNHISTNTAAFNYFASPASPDNEEDALKSFGASYFPGADASRLAESWRLFAGAMDYYPLSNPFIYRGPVNYTLSYHEIYVPGELTGLSSGPSHLVVKRGDELSDAFNCSHSYAPKDVFSLNEVITRLEKLASAWDRAVELLRKSLSHCPDMKARNEIGNAVICGAVWHSACNTFKIYRLRRNWKDSARAELMDIAGDELKVLREVLPYVEQDPRQGYHAEAHGYMFDPEGIGKKIRVLETL